MIKTNRILQTSLSKEGAESIPKEFVALYEKGALKHGLFRGLASGFVYGAILNFYENGFGNGLGILGAFACSSVANPFAVMQVHKQVFNGSVSKSYSQIRAEFGNPFRLFTLGVIPTTVRNLLVATSMIPFVAGIDYQPVQVLYAAGAILLSHPFEVARVIIQHQEKGWFGESLKILRGLYATDGVVGLYRGAIPRTIHTLPGVLTMAYLLKPISLMGQEGFENSLNRPWVQ